MTDKKWYSIEDIELAKAALSEMPDSPDQVGCS